MKKICFFCKQEKSLSEFYRHPKMADGHLNKCKVCIRAYVNSPEYREMARVNDRKRSQKPERKAYQLEAQRRKRAKHPEKSRAYCAVRRNLTPAPCIICGNPQSEAHHEDYSKPLQVVWLCFKHHRGLHYGHFCLF